jgi:hypothetical protein
MLLVVVLGRPEMFRPNVAVPAQQTRFVVLFQALALRLRVVRLMFASELVEKSLQNRAAC